MLEWTKQGQQFCPIELARAPNTNKLKEIKFCLIREIKCYRLLGH